MKTLKKFIDELGYPKSQIEPFESKETVSTDDKPQPEKKQKQEPGLLADVLRYANTLRSKKIDMTKGYCQWVKIAYGLANSFGEKGLPIFHIISSAGYE